MTAAVDSLVRKRPFEDDVESPLSKQRKVNGAPSFQHQLLLHKVKNPFELHRAGDVPVPKPGEVLIEVQAIGLNPIDWKSAQYGFGIPEFPCISGREFAGRVIHVNGRSENSIAVGDKVLSISTDYRDLRKSAFQQYAVASSFNIVKVPKHVDLAHTTSAGVAFVTAVLSLGICLGISLSSDKETTSFLKTAQAQDPETIPADVRDEVVNAISPNQIPQAGEWILIYGASSITGQMCIQLCKSSKLRTIAVASEKRHGERLRALGVDLVIDREDLDKAAQQISEAVSDPIRYAIDTVGKDTAAFCQKVLGSSTGPVDSPQDQTFPRSHLIGLTGLPKEKIPSVRQHKVPIKLFHENRALGTEISAYLTKLLNENQLQLPEVELLKGGLSSVNAGLDKIKGGQMGGKRVVVELDRTLRSNLAVWPPEEGGFCWC